MSDKCDNCHDRDFDPAPMLFDDVWQKLADKRETLCLSCMFARAIERKVDLSLSSLKPCPVNLFHWPYSDFNLFAQGETPPTRISSEWREAWNEMRSPPILCRVGDRVRRIDRDLYFDVWEQLAEEKRAEGLKGDDDALRCAIEEALPSRLGQVLDGENQ